MMALWRLPKQDVWHCIIDFSVQQDPQKIKLLDGKKGFVISPFVNPNLEKTYFISSDWMWNSDDEFRIPQNCQTTIEASFWEKFLKLSNKNHQKSLRYNTIEDLQEQSRHLSQVAHAVQKIKEGHLKKVVISRKQGIEFEEKPALVQLFDKLTKAYTNAFVSLIHHPKEGTWLGATPETLISVDQGQVFRTMALAGTQPFVEGKKISEAVWTQKEIEEQALVSRYIVDCFKKIRVREYEEEGPMTSKAGNLLHLKTDFWVDMLALEIPTLADTMLSLLHPTSAVCGMPLEASQKYIYDFEDQPRKLYAGFLGPVNISGEFNLFVNLRCMQIEGHKAYLFAGGGITEDSDPQKEWEETQHKCQTLLRVLD